MNNNNNQIKNKGLIRLWNATVFSMQGFKRAWVDEAAFRQELAAAVVMVPTAILLPLPLSNQLLLIMTVFLVIITELLNSAVEAVVDLVTAEHHPLAGKAKDLGSAAVLVSLMITVIVWGAVLSSHFLW